MHAFTSVNKDWSFNFSSSALRHRVVATADIEVNYTSGWFLSILAACFSAARLISCLERPADDIVSLPIHLGFFWCTWRTQSHKVPQFGIRDIWQHKMLLPGTGKCFFFVWGQSDIYVSGSGRTMTIIIENTEYNLRFIAALILVYSATWVMTMRAICCHFSLNSCAFDINSTL